MTLGPGLSSVLEFIPEGTVLGMEFKKYTIFSFLMFLSWFLVLIVFYIKFKGKDKKGG